MGRQRIPTQKTLAIGTDVIVLWGGGKGTRTCEKKFSSHHRGKKKRRKDNKVRK